MVGEWWERKIKKAKRVGKGARYREKGKKRKGKEKIEKNESDTLHDDVDRSSKFRGKYGRAAHRAWPHGKYV